MWDLKLKFKNLMIIFKIKKILLLINYIYWILWKINRMTAVYLTVKTLTSTKIMIIWEKYYGVNAILKKSIINYQIIFKKMKTILFNQIILAYNTINKNLNIINNKSKMIILKFKIKKMKM